MTQSADCFDTPWPRFLDEIDRDPRAAMAGFYDCVWRIAAVRPPAIFSSLTREQREDVLSAVVLKCCQDDLRRLRTYRPMGKPFSGWVVTLLFREAYDRITGKPPSDPIDDHPDPPAPVGREEDVLRDEIVRRCVARLSAKCQAYLRLFADGMRPREIVTVLKLGQSENKNVSDAIRHCLGKLETLLTGEGIGPDEAPA